MLIINPKKILLSVTKRSIFNQVKHCDHNQLFNKFLQIPLLLEHVTIIQKTTIKFTDGNS
jgi:hypothetical protein